MITKTALVIYTSEFGWTDLRMTVRGMPLVQTVGETTDPAQALDFAAQFGPD